MIVKISGKLIEERDQSLIISVQGMSYEVFVPQSVISRVHETKDENGDIHLVTYYYFQMGQNSGSPVLIGFMNEIERDFFLHFIKVSGIGPKAAIKALSKPISDVTQAIDRGDVNYLKTLQGIGAQRAKEIVAKLQGKIGKYGLIKDRPSVESDLKVKHDWQDEALNVLLQLQYKRNEAQDMIEKAVQQSDSINSAEELLNEIYKQKLTVSI